MKGVDYMTMPKAYEPEQDTTSILNIRIKNGTLRLCKRQQERDFLLKEYRTAYGIEFTFKTNNYNKIWRR